MGNKWPPASSLAHLERFEASENFGERKKFASLQSQYKLASGLKRTKARTARGGRRRNYNQKPVEESINMNNISTALIALALLQAICICLVQAQRAPSQAAQNFCRANKGKVGAVFAHEEYCDYYYECDEATDEPLVQACPNGLAFAGFRRGLSSHCDYPHRVSCPDGTRVIGQQPVASENCAWSYGVFPHATSCTRYWHCWNGTATIQQCPFSLLYNDAIHACDWPDNVPDCQKHPICKDTPNGLVFIEKSCVRYWLCVGGYPRLQRCPAGLAVNPTSLKCELATTVPGCEPPPTTTPAEEETSEGNSGNSPASSGGQAGNNNQQEGGQGGQQARPSQAFPTPFKPPAQATRVVG